MPLERAGGQAQFIVHEPPVADRTSIGQLLSWDSTESLRRSLPSCYRSARGHEHSNVNATFSRASRDDPSQLDFWGPCVRRAQALLETTQFPVERVAAESGFGSAAVMRQHFVAIVGTSPLSYRRAFSCGEKPTPPRP